MECCKIERAANGWEVEIFDPSIAKENEKSKGRWRDPMVSHVFKDTKEMLKFLNENLEKAYSEDEYASSFAQLSEEDND